MREKILLDESWQFHRGDVNMSFPKSKGLIYMQAKTERAQWGAAAYEYDDRTDPYGCYTTERWETVDLPHDYVIEQTPDKNENNTLGFFKYENAWYRKRFELTEDDMDKRITLYFEGITANSTIYVNGCLMKHNFCGYTSFEVDITDVALFDKPNIAAVYVDTSNHEGWWYEGAGIYRHVWLVKTAKTAVDLYGVYVNPIKDGEVWRTEIETTVINCGEIGEVTVKSVILDSDGHIAAETDSAAMTEEYGKSIVKQRVEIREPKLWDIDTPNLYSIETTLIQNGKEIDKTANRFGFRTIEYRADSGFYLNGRNVKINGVCCHYDCGLTGKAVSDNIAKYKVKLLKEMGANAYRTSHYPHSEATMDALDEEGMLAMDETRWFADTEEGKAQLEMLVKRDRNRPSVIMWSTGNEEPIHCTERGKKIQKALKSHIRRFDTSRPVTSAVSNDPHIAPVLDELDIIGVNYNLDRYEEIHKKYPDKAIFASECCATSTTRGYYHDDSKERGYMRSYDHDTDSWFRGRENTYSFLSQYDWFAGGFQWAGFEHRGETVWPRLCSQAGAIDLFLQKKDAFYQNQSFWLEQPVLHLLPHWNHEGREGETIKVWAYTNCDETELFLNGKSLGRIKTGRFEHGEWKVEYESGVLEAAGYINGAEAVRDRIETTGKAVSLNLRLDNEISKANGCDIAVVTCYCTDSEGRIVPDASPFVSFNSNGLGKIIATGSDVCDHTPVTSLDRRMRAGLCTAAVKVGKTAGTLKVYASAQGLKSARLDIELKA